MRWTSVPLLLLAACAAPPDVATIEIAHLERDGVAGLEPLRRVFQRANPGYDVEWHAPLAMLRRSDRARVVFIQRGDGTATVDESTSAVAVGDVLVVRPKEKLRVDAGDLDAVVFEVPATVPEDVPSFVRPDFDPNITDTPGGCAEESDAYRRVLLTWLGKVGPYLWHDINCHRVRIKDSFSHYHPSDIGFDEFYLVQLAPPGAKLIVSDRVDLIESPAALTEDDAAALLTELPLKVGDLVYLPRGTMHRGVGGAVVQVITVPGFVPNAEIGVDHHLRRINERLSLEGDAALPFHAAAADAPVVK